MRIRDLMLRLRVLLAPRRAERDLDDELSFHIEREARKLIDEGLPPDRARATARARFGSTALIADACRDERRTAWVDDTVSDVRFALRSFRRAPLTAFTIVATVAIGLGVVAVLFTFLNAFLFRTDTVPGIEEIYTVEHARQADGEAVPFTRDAYDALRRETGVFTDVYATIADIDLRVDGRMMSATLVTASFFDVVRLQPVMGRVFGPGDDQPGGHRGIVLSDRGWARQFDRDPHVLGRTVLVNGTPFDIIGVMPPSFRGLEFKASDFWAPLAQLPEFEPGSRGQEGRASVAIVGRLPSGVPVESARARIDAWEANRRVAASERARDAVVLVPRRGTIPRPLEALAVFAPLFVAFGLILLIGCANVANLLLARGVARQREIGVRVSLGASRRRIVRQLMTESALLALLAAACGYAISRVLLRVAVYWASRAMPVDLGTPKLEVIVPAADWRVAVFLVVLAVAATAFFALLPALQATRIAPLRTLRGELIGEARPRRARNALIGLQVFASALLLICAAIFLRSAIASSRFDPGFRTIDTVVIGVNEPKRTAVVQAIATDPAIAAYGAVRPGMLAWPDGAMASSGGRRTSVLYKFVSPEYFAVFDVPIVRGRSFTAAERDGGAAVVIVSESTARRLWPRGSGVGETFRLEPDSKPVAQPQDEPPMPARLVTVVGVSRDVPGFRFIDAKEAGVFLPTTVTAARTVIVARVKGDARVAHRTLVDRLTRVDPNMGLIMAMHTLATLETLFLQVGFWVSLVLGGLALVLTLSGLFSVLSYVVEQRTREIGVRMALGASSRAVARLMLAQTARPVAWGLLAGAGCAAAVATALTAMPGGATVTTIVRVTDPMAYVASVLVIVAACLFAAWIPVARAARLDPMRTLRHD